MGEVGEWPSASLRLRPPPVASGSSHRSGHRMERRGSTGTYAPPGESGFKAWDPEDSRASSKQQSILHDEYEKVELQRKVALLQAVVGVLTCLFLGFFIATVVLGVKDADEKSCSPSPSPPSDSSVVAQLKSELTTAGVLLGRSKWINSTSMSPKPVSCTCADYCNGACFSSGCRACDVEVWSRKNDGGGVKNCLDPGPFGTGLLCATHPDGTVSGVPCCTVGGAQCTLQAGSCCADLSCDKCDFKAKEPFYPKLNATPLTKYNRSWDDANTQCMHGQAAAPMPPTPAPIPPSKHNHTDRR